MHCFAAPRSQGEVLAMPSSYAVYYGHAFSYECYEQSRDRIHGRGRKRPCVYYDLLGRDTCDQASYESLKSKKSKNATIKAIMRQAHHVGP